MDNFEDIYEVISCHCGIRADCTCGWTIEDFREHERESQVKKINANHPIQVYSQKDNLEFDFICWAENQYFAGKLKEEILLRIYVEIRDGPKAPPSKGGGSYCTRTACVVLSLARASPVAVL